MSGRGRLRAGMHPPADADAATGAVAARQAASERFITSWRSSTGVAVKCGRSNGQAQILSARGASVRSNMKHGAHIRT